MLYRIIIMSSINLEGLEIKEATPSIAPSIYESFQYTKKWRIIIALGIGISLIALCVLIFYLTAESKRPKGPLDVSQTGKLDSVSAATLKEWRSLEDEECLASTQPECPKDFGDIPVFLLVLGGLRTDQVTEIPALLELTKCGASTRSLVPSYPSFSFPNLYSIATGLYPESHGIVSFKMYDDEIGKNFTIGSSSTLDTRWWGGEPIWSTLEKHGKKTATYLWPGSNVKIKGFYPSYLQRDKIDFLERIRKVMDWIELPKKERPQLIMMYYEEPDMTAQKFGVFSPRTLDQLKIINNGLDELMSSLQRANLYNCLNLIVASDHGVAASSCEKTVYIEDMLEEPLPGRLFTGSVGRIDFFEGTDESVKERIIKKLQCRNPSLRALEKKQVPKRYHYTSGPRIGDIILDTKPGSRVSTDTDGKCLIGEYGFDILSRSMQGIFSGHGPSFKVGYRTDSYRNIEVYDLLTNIFGVQPAPNNGTQGSLLSLLKRKMVKEDDYVKPQISYLRETIKPFPKRPNDAVLGKVADKESLPACPCEQMDPAEQAPLPPEDGSATIASSSTISTSSSTSTTTTSTTTASTTTASTTTASTTTTPTTTTSTTTNPTTTTQTSESTTSSTSTSIEPMITSSETSFTNTSQNTSISNESSESTTTSAIAKELVAKPILSSNPESTNSSTTTTKTDTISSSTSESSIPDILLETIVEPVTVSSSTTSEPSTSAHVQISTTIGTENETTESTIELGTAEKITTTSEMTLNSLNNSAEQVAAESTTTESTPKKSMKMIDLESVPEPATTNNSVLTSTESTGDPIIFTTSPTSSMSVKLTEKDEESRKPKEHSDEVKTVFVSEATPITTQSIPTSSITQQPDISTTITSTISAVSSTTEDIKSSTAEDESPASLVEDTNVTESSTMATLGGLTTQNITSTEASTTAALPTEGVNITESTRTTDILTTSSVTSKTTETLTLPEGLEVMSLVKEKSETDAKIVDESSIHDFHCPWGSPSYSAPEVANDTLNVLLHSSYIIGFPESLNMGVWSSYTLTKKKFTELRKQRPKVPDGSYIKPEERNKNLPVGCWISDSRLQRSSSDQCSRVFKTNLYDATNTSLRQLFPEEFELPAKLSSEGFLLSNLAPLRKGFEMGARRIMLEAIEKWAVTKGELNVVHGPIFDYDFDGKRDDVIKTRDNIKPLIPSNYYYVVTSCNGTINVEDMEEEAEYISLHTCPLESLNVYSFIFPNTENDDVCKMGDREYLRYHMASLADVEDLTSIKFFKKMEYKSYIQLRAQQPLRILPF